MTQLLGLTKIACVCIAPGALVLFDAASSRSDAGNEGPYAQVTRDWTSFPPADRASCLMSTGSGGAYSDLIRCLETKRDARRYKEPDSTVGQAGDTR
jgi:hypothetical protein